MRADRVVRPYRPVLNTYNGEYPRADRVARYNRPDEASKNIRYVTEVIPFMSRNTGRFLQTVGADDPVCPL